MKSTKNESPIRLLVSAIVLFEAITLLLIAIKPPFLNTEALMLAVALPLLCWISTILLPKFVPMDQLLMALTNFLCGVGIIILYSIVPERGLRQALLFALGLGAMMAGVLFVRWIRNWKTLCWLMIPASIGLLLLPIAVGVWNNDVKNIIAMRWFGNFQPSEIVKLMAMLVLAHFFSQRRGIRRKLPALLFVAACLGVLLLQRDLGTALMYYLTALAMYFVSTGNGLISLLGLVGAAVSAVVAYHIPGFAYVRVRVAIWRNPWDTALGSGYQIIQALMAIGSGGLWGLGLGLGLPRIIPAYHTDFIFAVICEQFGLVFGVCVVLVYVALLARGFSIALRARRSFYALLAFGCTTLLGIQTFVIIGGVIKMIPLTGITMPFVSYGGTSLVSCLTLIGFLHGVSARIEADTEQDIAIVEASEDTYDYDYDYDDDDDEYDDEDDWEVAEA
ncbi:MAG: FtsW/RodA/SpoVE family cell cycle protein [Clostridia bacterium]|nr:FtsW/RodA/SpoVE family cell cycle protein [Clostridia bacterium]